MKTVERGARFLDTMMPGWDEQIDLDELDLAEPCRCILGQLHAIPGRHADARYDAGLNALGLSPTDGRWYGFDLWARGYYSSLTAAWRGLIERRGKTA